MTFIFRKRRRKSTCTQNYTSEIIPNKKLTELQNEGNNDDSLHDNICMGPESKEDLIRNVTQSGHTKDINNSMIMVDNQLYSSDILMIDNELYASSDVRNNEPPIMIDNEIYAKY